MLQSCNIQYIIQMRKRIWTKLFLFLCINLNCWRVIFLAKAQTLSGRIGKVVASYAYMQGWLLAQAAPIYIMHDELKGYCPWGWGLTATQFDLPSLTPLSVAGCGQWSITTRSCLLSYFSSITASRHWYLTPQTAVVDSHLRDSWPNETLPFFTVTLFTKFILWWNFSQIWTFWVSM